MQQTNATDRPEPHRQQREITRLCIQCALLLLQHGAESTVVEQLSTRLGWRWGWTAWKARSPPMRWC